MGEKKNIAVKLIHWLTFSAALAAFIVLICLDLFDKNFRTVTGLVLLMLGFIGLVIAVTYGKDGSYIPPLVLLSAGIAFFIEVFGITTSFGILSFRLMYPVIFLGAAAGGAIVHKNGAPVSKYYYIINLVLYAALTLLMLLLSR